MCVLEKERDTVFDGTFSSHLFSIFFFFFLNLGQGAFYVFIFITLIFFLER